MANFFLEEKRKRLCAHTNLSYINSLSTYNEFLSKKMFKISLYNKKLPIFLRNSFLQYIKENFNQKLYLFASLKFLKKILGKFLTNNIIKNNINLILKIFKNINMDNTFEKISDNILNTIKFPLITNYNDILIKEKEQEHNNNIIYNAYKSIYILKKHLNKNMNSFKYFQYIFKIFGTSKKFSKRIKTEPNKSLTKSELEFRTLLVTCALNLDIQKILEKEVYITCKLRGSRKWLKNN